MKRFELRLEWVTAALLAASVGAIFIAGIATAAPPTSTDGYTGSGSAPSAVTPNVTHASPFMAVNLGGGADSSGPNVVGACPGFTCNASSGDCACTTYVGTLRGAGFREVSAEINITEDDDDTTPDGGGGRCFPATGTATLSTSGAKPSVAVLGLTGSICQYIQGSAFTVNGNFAYSQEPNIGGSKKFATSFGTGNISVTESVDEYNGTFYPAAVSAVGTLQLKQ